MSRLQVPERRFLCQDDSAAEHRVRRDGSEGIHRQIHQRRRPATNDRRISAGRSATAALCVQHAGVAHVPPCMSRLHAGCVPECGTWVGHKAFPRLLGSIPSITRLAPCRYDPQQHSCRLLHASAKLVPIMHGASPGPPFQNEEVEVPAYFAAQYEAFMQPVRTVTA